MILHIEHKGQIGATTSYFVHVWFSVLYSYLLDNNQPLYFGGFITTLILLIFLNKGLL